MMLALVGLVFAASLQGAPSGAAPPDLIVFAPRVRTLDPQRPLAEFVAVRGDSIVAVGAHEEGEKLGGPKTRRIELPAGSCLIPGFVDSHAHLLATGRARREVDLVGTRTFEEVVEKVAARAKQRPQGEWIRGRGWDQNDWPVQRFPEHAPLSAAAPRHPVCLWRIDGHAVLVNEEALRLAGIDATTPAPKGGEILRDARGLPTGVLIDEAIRLVERAMTSPGDAESEEALELALARCRELGVTMVHDAGVGRRALALYQRAAEAGRLTTRIYAMLAADEDVDGDPAGGPFLAEHFARGPSSDPSGLLTVRAVKVYADGALGSRGALLLDDYADRPLHRGLALVDRARLADLSRRALEAGFQVCTHAIGDAANRLVLDAYEDALETFAATRPAAPRPDHRFRIEHAQVIARSDLPRFAALGVIASVQTCHATSDAPWAPDRLGSGRARDEAYVWRDLIEAGATLCNGTDSPVEPLSPLRNLYAAVTRLDPGGALAQPFQPEQRLSPEEALRSLTCAGAHAAFAEERLGRIGPGFLADLVALSVDPLERPPSEWLATSVDLTIVNGRIVHARR
jgi:hypothetical protein